MPNNDLDALNLDTVRAPHRRSRLFLENDPPMSVEDDMPMSVRPSDTRRTSRASAVFLFVFVVVVGSGGALAWRSYGDQATAMIRDWALPGTTSKPTAALPEGFAEFQQQLKSMTVDLAAVKHTLEQYVANQDQLTRKQEEMAHKQEQMTQAIAALQTAKQDSTQKISAPLPANKPVHVPVPKPAQQPAHTQGSSKPIQISPPQSLLPPKQ
jgi:hypothetical protein